jgi:hypothetical protein
VALQKNYPEFGFVHEVREVPAVDNPLYVFKPALTGRSRAATQPAGTGPPFRQAPGRAAR